MQPEHFQQLKSLFQRACELNADERSAFLDAECGDNTELRGELDRLHTHAGIFQVVVPQVQRSL